MARVNEKGEWIWDAGHWNYEEARRHSSSLALTYGPNKWQPGQPPMPVVYPDLEPPRLEILRLHPEARLPVRSLPEAAGLDIHAHLLSESGHPTKRLLPPRVTTSVPTAIAVRPPPGCCILVLSRSGLAKHSLFVANAPGLIDPDYTGEILVLLYNGSFESHWVEHGQRIAQILIAPLTICVIREVQSFPSTVRGDKGFGSTGA